MFQQLLTIARNTFVESTRQPIYVVMLLLTTVLLVLNTSLAAYTMSDDNKILIDMGLSTLFLAGLLLAAFTATGVLSAEVELENSLARVTHDPALVRRPVLAAAVADAGYTVTNPGAAGDDAAADCCC